MPTTVSVLATVADPQLGMRIDVVTGTGFTLTFDTNDSGDKRAGAGPTESLLAALAGCASIDVRTVLRKKRQSPSIYRIAVTGQRRDEHPQIYTEIVIEHQVGGDVEVEALRRAIELSATRYCPVNAMLSRAVRIEHRYRLAQDGHEEISALVAIIGPEGAQVL